VLALHCQYNQIPYCIVGLDDTPTPSAGDVVLCCGTRALDRWKAVGLVAKNRSLGSMRGQLFKSPSSTPIFFTFDPALIHREADKPGEIIWDANLAARYMKTGSVSPVLGTYEWGKLADVIIRAEGMIEQDGYCILGSDLETHGFYPWYDDKHIVTSQWSWDHAVSIVISHTGGWGLRDKEDLEWLLNEPRIKVWGANLKYDLVWIAAKLGIECTNFTFDTLLGGSLVNENRSNSLNNHTKIYVPELGGYDESFNAKYDKGQMPTNLAQNPEEFLGYSGGDSDATRRCGFLIQDELTRDIPLTRFYQKVLHPAARAFEKIERRGLLVDPARFAAVREQVVTDVKEHTDKCMRAIPLKVRAMHAHDLRLSRPKLKIDTMFSPAGFNLTPIDTTPKTKKPKSTISHFQKFDDPRAVEFVSHLKKLGSATKTLSTYIDGFLKHVRPDGRFHPTYALHAGALYEERDKAGTVTGRLSAKNPAIQTLTKHNHYAKLLRSCYPAPPGMLFWQLDFSQGELRMTAEIANEPNMTQAYLKGMDLHSITAADLNGIPLEEFLLLKKTDPALYKELRQGGKAGNFGLIYGMSAGGFVVYAFDTYGVKLPFNEAKDFRDRFLNVLWPRLPKWHEETIKQAQDWGYVRNPLGRIRHLPLINSPEREIRAKAERQAINAPVQGALNDIGLYLLALIDERYGDADENEFSVNGQTHDALYGYVAEGKWELWFHRIQAIVDEMPDLFRSVFDWHPALTFPIDWELGPRWDTLEEVKLAA
jgi:DNA polymerase I-like protein with 3'-5' exonuclease and polymerase domains